MKHAYWKPIRKLKDHPWDVKKQIADISSKRHAWINLSFLFSPRCNCAQWHNQYVPLNETCKKVFGWHLLKTISFLKSQITQHIADMPVNKYKFGLRPPCFNQWLNKSSTSFGGAKPKIKWIALTAIEKKVLDTFVLISKAANFTSNPVSPS